MKKVKELILDGNPQLPESNPGSAATTHGRVVPPLGAIASQLERIAAALEVLVRTSKEKENLPPTPPIREKEGTHTDTPRACVREGFLVPTLAEVAAYIKANGLSVDAEKFWNHYNAIGWKVGKSPIRCWQSVCHVWDRGDKRQALKEAAQLAHFDAKADERAEKRQAHIDAKMDERERKRERRAVGGRKKADNWVAMTDEVREAVRRDFDF